MRRPILLIILATFSLGIILAGGLYWRWYKSPRYALQQMVLALQARNMQKFFNYVDLKAIFNNILESSGKNLDLPNDSQNDELNRLVRRLGRSFARQVLPKLFENFENQIRGVMEQYLLKLDNSRILALGAAVTVARIDIQGNEARVTISDPQTKEPFRFQMRRYPDGQWRIVAINYEDLKKLIKREWQE